MVALTETASVLKYQKEGLPTQHDVPELHSDHEEADTRLVLHAKHASESHYEQVILWSPDTDVAAIGISHADRIGHLLFATGTSKHQRLLDLTIISNHLEGLSPHLIALHALTGCDSVSSFHGKGKKGSLKVVMSDGRFQQALSDIGPDYQISRLPPGMEELVCTIYGSKAKNVAEARFELFVTATTEKSLPPSVDALMMHVKRVNYQSKVWRSALLSRMEAPSPAGHGWKIVDGELAVHWLEGPYAPSSVLKTVKCGCRKTDCTGRKCLCHMQGLRCTVLCKCGNCSNQSLERQTDNEDDSDDDKQ